MPKPRATRASEEEVIHRWEALTFERQQDVLSFDEPVLVDRIKSALQALFEQQRLMNELGIRLQTDADPFSASTLFTCAFKFTWQIGRSSRNPNIVVMDPKRMPVMAADLDFLQTGRLFEELRNVVPDFLSSRSGRVPLSKPRWKDLWTTQPSSVSAIEQQLVKLVEQALWAMATDPSYEPEVQITSCSLVDSLDADSVPFEHWMVGASGTPQNADAKKKNKQRKKKGPSSPARVRTEGSVADTVESSLDVEDGDEPEGLSECLLLHEEQPVSDDELVDMGVLTGESKAYGMSSEPTASSTPGEGSAATKGWKSCWMPAPPSPSVPQDLHPRQLVCYIWNQTSQFSSQNGLDAKWNSSSDRPADTPATPISATQTRPATPSARGSSRNGRLKASGSSTPSAPVLSVVVRNSFIDIDDPDEEKDSYPSRPARSLSPSHYAHFGRDDWHDHWHV